MRRILLGVMCLIVVGCSYYEGKPFSAYLSDPKMIIKDPHFAEYKENLDYLERQYLREEITYDQYVSEKKEIDDKYEREVQKRNSRIEQ